ncbi:hypothetical protein P4H70_18785 [Paenibacillus ehimensis]|uniref:HNH endonuclease n=1 Tax=Paenibacillus ehimensis TaxID=79264 RepID=UPI002DB8F397|nr:HNH endonuclease [Paenibacillus ehimensis]MEC0210990.1 hypothetical protein [Paenibacillus ehimensis]
MPQFIRRKRYVTYKDKRCRKYLRIDFDYKCAYCGSNEAEFIVGYKAFQIDHFIPQNLASMYPEVDLDKYDNLYYSCEMCNSVTGKSGKWDSDLLDPCKDNIYSGENHHIEYGVRLKHLTQHGKKFIETLNLNSLEHRRVREVREEFFSCLREKEIEIVRMLENLDLLEKQIGSNPSITDSRDALLRLLEQTKEESKGKYYFVKSDELFDHPQEKIFENVLSKYVSFSKIYYDYDLDYEIVFEGNNTIWCSFHIRETVNFNSHNTKKIRLSSAQIRDWKAHILPKPIVIMVLDESNNKIYYCNALDIIENDFSAEREFITFYIRKDSELCETNADNFLSVLSTLSDQRKKRLG